MHEEAIQLVQEKLGSEAGELFTKLLNQKPEEADAIVLLQGDRLDRALKVVDLFISGYASHILITGNNTRDPEDVKLAELQDVLVSQGIDEDAIIIDDASMNAKDQAVHTIKHAKDEGWKNLMIVVSPYHALRAYLSFVKQAMEQKWNGKIIVQISDAQWNQVPGGREQSALALLDDEIEKIGEYESDLATFKEGVNKY